MHGQKTKDQIIKYLKESNRQKNLGEATSFRDYMRGLVGLELEEAFFRYYPEKVWGITTDKMLPDWAPKKGSEFVKKGNHFIKVKFLELQQKGQVN